MASSSASSSGAADEAFVRGTTAVPPPIVDTSLPSGKVIMPHRAIGDVKPEEPAVMPSKWPAHIEAILKRRKDQPVRVYMDGIWDLCHFGHYRAMEQAKRSLPNVHLIVGCCNDEITHRLKGQTVLQDKERYESLRAVKWVDEIIPDAPWVITDDFLAKHDIDLVAHDALPYVDTSGQSATGDVYSHLKAVGKFHETQRTEGVSTSDLIIRIVSRYDDFIRRNLSRGYTAKDLNLGFIQGQVFKIEMALEKQADKARKQAEKITNDAKASVTKLSDQAESLHYRFVKMVEEGPSIVKTTLRNLKDEVIEGLSVVRRSLSLGGGEGGEGREEEQEGGSSISSRAAASSSSEAEGLSAEGEDIASHKEEKESARASSAAPSSRKGAGNAKGASRRAKRAGKTAGDDDDETEQRASKLRAASFAIEHSSGAALNALKVLAPAPGQLSGKKRKASTASAGTGGKEAGGESDDDEEEEEEGEGGEAAGKNAKGKKAPGSPHHKKARR